MKFLFPSILLFLCSLTLTAQESGPTTVVSTLNSIQANLGSIFYVHERALGESLTLRLEAGVRQQYYYSNRQRSANYYAFRPEVRVGGRYYYNLMKRAEEGKITSNNSGQFVGLVAAFRPSFFVWTTNDNVGTDNSLGAQVHWGLRRQLGKRIDFEFTAGLGLRANGRVLGQRAIVGLTGGPRLDWRFGYRF